MPSFLIGLLIFVAIPASAQFSVPPLTGPVVDHAGLMTSGESEVARAPKAFIRPWAQVEMLTVTSLGNFTIEEAAIRVALTWKQEAGDNGVLLMVSKVIAKCVKSARMRKSNRCLQP